MTAQALERATQVFLGVREVKAQIGALLAAHPDISEDAQLLADSLEGETSLNEVMEQLVRLERDADIIASAIRVEEARLAERRDRYTQQKDKYRAMMLQLLEAAGQHKLVLPTATVSVTHGVRGVIITDEDALPDEFVVVERKPMKSAIAAVLKAGGKVEGAELRNGTPHIAIRT